LLVILLVSFHFLVASCQKIIWLKPVLLIRLLVLTNTIMHIPRRLQVEAAQRDNQDRQREARRLYLVLRFG
jgi:hypothetical protein